MQPAANRNEIFTFVFLSFLSICLGIILSPTKAVAQEKTHPSTWVKDHGKEYVESPFLCKACHGEELDGSIAGIPCNLCHLTPKHPMDWKETHGPEYLKDKSQCITCHTKKPFSGEKRPWSMNCTRCHSINADPSRWQQESHTSQVYVNSYNTGMIYEDRFGEKNFVSDNYFGVNYSERSKQIIFNSQARLSREWLHQTQNFDLYEASLQFDNLLKNRVNLSLGRQSFLSNVDFFLVDGVTVNIRPVTWFDVDLYAGIPRYIERGDIDGDIGLVTGLNWTLKETKSYTSARLGVSYQKQNFNSNDWDVTDKMYVSGSFSQGVSIFRFYGLGEYDLTSQIAQSGSVGVEIYPFAKKIGFLIEGDYYNESRSDALDSVFTFFSTSSLWQGKGGIFVNAVKNLNLYQNFSLQRYDIQDSEFRYGFNAETGGAYYIEKWRTDVSAAYFFIRSYGGVLHGGKLGAYTDWSNRIYSNLTVDAVTYEKVTNDDNKGVSASLTGGVKITPELSFSTVVEYIFNDVMERDLRGLLRLDYIFNKKFLEFDKKNAARDEAKKSAVVTPSSTTETSAPPVLPASTGTL